MKYGEIRIRRIADSCDTTSWLAAVAEQPYPALLESSLYHPDHGVFSILSWDPYKKIHFSSGLFTTEDFAAGEVQVLGGDPFSMISAEFDRHRIPGMESFPLPFAGGAIGYFSYDLRHNVENLPRLCSYDLDIPEFILCFYNNALVFDHKKGVTYWVGKDTAQLRKVVQRREDILNRHRHIGSAAPDPGKYLLTSDFCPEKYRAAVGRVIDYIAAGDIFQVNLSQRFAGDCNRDALEIYAGLRSVNPAPFSAFLRYPEFEIISSSPERFLLLDNGRVITRPIKGTRPRRAGKDEFNSRMIRELSESEKDHAELAMIVDLERNDIGRVCSYGSVKVREHAVMETYPTVYHLVSTVEGVLHRPEFDEFDLLRAAFPGGSISGAPKVRAMEIIEELEPVARNVYTGCAGYISFHGRMDMNILIRTMLKTRGHIYLHVGGGIVADSDPAAEYHETMHKGKALFAALGASNYYEKNVF